MLPTLLFAIVTVLGVAGDPFHTAPQTPGDSVLVMIDGVKRATTGVAANPPKDVTRQRAPIAAFGGRENVRTEDGKVVNGIGFMAWRQDRSVVVAVFVLVPGDDQPNTNVIGGSARSHADVSAEGRRLSHRHLINYVLKDNEAVEVKEAASLGFGTTTIQLVPVKTPATEL